MNLQENNDRFNELTIELGKVLFSDADEVNKITDQLAKLNDEYHRKSNSEPHYSQSEGGQPPSARRSLTNVLPGGPPK